MRAHLTIAAVALLALAACGPAANGTPTPQPPANGPVSGEVDIVDLGYQPESYDVSAGTTVTWTNTGDLPHTVTFDDGTVDSGDMAAGATFQHTFDSAGTFAYHCRIHPQMVGTVNVSP